MIFNAKNGSLQGELYRYSLSGSGDPRASVESDRDNYSHYYARWKSDQKKYVDTFDRFSSDPRMAVLFDAASRKESYSSYSERSKKWTNEKGEERITLLSVVDGTYRLYTFSPSKDTWQKQDLKIEEKTGDRKQKQQSFPAFAYTGSDPYINPIVNYFRERDSFDPDDPVSEKSVWIPEFIIVNEVKKEDEVFVFGCFGSTNYIQTGNVLESRSGAGTNPACVRLKPVGDEYEVVRVDCPRDGAFFGRDIKKFTKGYPGLYDQIMKAVGSEKKQEKVLYHSLSEANAADRNSGKPFDEI